MAYCDYGYYTTVFRGGYTGGSFISPEAFPYLSNQASLCIRSATRGLSDKAASEEAAEAVKNATCAIAEVFQNESLAVSKRSDAGGGIVSSESVGAWSRSYVTGVNVSEAEYWDKQKRGLLEMYLGFLPEFAGMFRVKSYRCVHEARGCGR